MAREQLDVTTVIFSNRRYAILRMELARVGATASGERALQMLDIAPPEIDFVSLAQGFGVPASRPDPPRLSPRSSGPSPSRART